MIWLNSALVAKVRGFARFKVILLNLNQLCFHHSFSVKAVMCQAAADYLEARADSACPVAPPATVKKVRKPHCKPWTTKVALLPVSGSTW